MGYYEVLLAAERRRQDRIEKRTVDHQHFVSVMLTGVCIGCGLPHGVSCQCQNTREFNAGMDANADFRAREKVMR